MSLIACPLPLLLNGVGVALKGFDRFLVVAVLPGGDLLTGLIQRFAARNSSGTMALLVVQVGVDAHGFRADLLASGPGARRNGFAGEFLKQLMLPAQRGVIWPVQTKSVALKWCCW